MTPTDRDRTRGTLDALTGAARMLPLWARRGRYAQNLRAARATRVVHHDLFCQLAAIRAARKASK